MTQITPSPVSASTTARENRQHTLHIGNSAWAATLLLLPTFIGFILFYLYPTIRGLQYSFTNYNLLSRGENVGLSNYVDMLSDEDLRNSLLNTCLFAVLNLIVQLFFGLLLAALMQRLRAKPWVRSLLLLPWLVPNVAIALIWGWLLDANVGFLTKLFASMGLQGVTFYNSRLALLIVVAISAWAGIGYTSLLLYAGMLQIPADLYEAGSIDGAGETRMFFSITLPLIRPVLAMVVVVTLIGSFQVFDLVQVGYRGNPLPEVRVIYYYIYRQAFEYFHMGYASAISILLVLILGALTFLQMHMMHAGESELS
ncbi:carbohydrate ABC transporter permease [Bifidobacterium sp.]|jgi:multiple sugar transport system permease protein|uniref:carbohydrate ABC transporter permease n=1 Tax=Bifidobacterium sp. TaxID=41200 RepID=UPI0025C5B688|nr:sugar ABC transporter permease [Bifidobacterium sp.]MCH4209107.1 sugar ABC transporter permease [Bifidobacterium sp.]MCI1224712.1 sugar ABC transporter permease [Bifidobacterium sp.]